MWLLFAVGSAFFAGVTSILAKCGIRKTDSTVATGVLPVNRTMKNNKVLSASRYRLAGSYAACNTYS